MFNIRFSLLNDQTFYEACITHETIRIVNDSKYDRLLSEIPRIPKDSICKYLIFDNIIFVQPHGGALNIDIPSGLTLSLWSCEFRDNVYFRDMNTSPGQLSLNAGNTVFKKSVFCYFSNSQIAISLASSFFHEDLDFLVHRDGSISVFEITSCDVDKALIFQGDPSVKIDKAYVHCCSIDRCIGLDQLDIHSSDVDTMRAFKALALSVHDNYMASEFHKSDMLYLLQSMAKQGKKIQPDLFLLRLNNFTSCFGTSWFRAFNITWLFMLVFFFGCLASLGISPFNLGWVNFHQQWLAFSEGLKLFVQFILPAHSFDMWKGYSPTGLTYLLDLLSRIVFSYGVYQIIISSRSLALK